MAAYTAYGDATIRRIRISEAKADRWLHVQGKHVKDGKFHNIFQNHRNQRGGSFSVQFHENKCR